MAEHCLNQRAACSPVAIGEGMDGLELGVRERSVCKNWKIGSLDKHHEIFDRVGDTIVMWRNEQREVRPQVPTADPDLLGAPTPCVDWIELVHQRVVHRENRRTADVVGQRQRRHHCARVGDDLDCILSARASDLGLCNRSCGCGEVLDARAGSGFGPQKDRRELGNLSAHELIEPS